MKPEQMENLEKGEAKMAEITKVKAEIVWLGTDGAEVKRETKGRGRPPKGAAKRDDGNFYVTAEANVPVKPVYKFLDGHTEPKGRGRPKPNFTKAADGNWVENAKK